MLSSAAKEWGHPLRLSSLGFDVQHPQRVPAPRPRYDDAAVDLSLDDLYTYGATNLLDADAAHLQWEWEIPYHAEEAPGAATAPVSPDKSDEAPQSVDATGPAAPESSYGSFSGYLACASPPQRAANPIVMDSRFVADSDGADANALPSSLPLMPPPPPRPVSRGCRAERSGSDVSRYENAVPVPVVLHRR